MKHKMYDLSLIKSDKNEMKSSINGVVRLSLFAVCNKPT
jgi:hypothetical protein